MTGIGSNTKLMYEIQILLYKSYDIVNVVYFFFFFSLFFWLVKVPQLTVLLQECSPNIQGWF